MLRHRVIPSLLVRDGGLVKSVKFSKHRYIGDPINAIRIFNEKEVDELLVLDIDASRESRGPNFALVESVASECFMPLTYGGGVRTLDDARRLFSMGVEKVSVQTAALTDLEVVSRIAKDFGSQSVVVSLDLKRNLFGALKLRACSTGKTVSENWQRFLVAAVEAGAGEVLLMSVDNDGTMAGMDTDLIREAATISAVPVIASGGAGSLEHLKQAVDAGANAIAAGSMFVYQGQRRAVLITYPEYESLVSLLDGKAHAG